MEEYPIQLGVTERAEIILVQTNKEDGQEHVITISPDQVEQVVSALRAAAKTIRELK